MNALSPIRVLVSHVDNPAVLSPSVRYVARTATSRGAAVTVARADELHVVGGKLVIGGMRGLGGKRGPLPHAVIVRGGADHSPDALRGLRELEAAGVPLTNSPSTIELVGHKGNAAEVLFNTGIPHPPSVTIRPGSGDEVRAQVLRAIEELGTEDIVLKPNSGMGGAGVMFLDGTSEIGLRSVVDTVMPRTDGKGFIAQKWLREGTGQDLRAYVSTVDGKLKASPIGLERRAAAGQGAANVANGGSSGYVDIPDEMQATSIRAAKAMGLRFGSVDFMKGPGGWQVVEVNTSPGVGRSVAMKLGFDQAALIVDDAIASASR